MFSHDGGHVEMAGDLASGQMGIVASLYSSKKKALLYYLLFKYLFIIRYGLCNKVKHS